MVDSNNTSTSPELKTLLDALGTAIGDILFLDETGQCALAFADDVELIIAAAGDDQISIRTPLARVNADNMRTALALNYGSLPAGLWIALDDISSELLLLTIARATDIPPELFQALVAEMVSLVATLRSHLNKSAAPDPPEEPSRMFFATSMIRA